jgi:hypothetical protein
VQGPVIVISQELVQIDIEEPIAGYDPPAQQIGIILAADVEIRITPEKTYYTLEDRWKFHDPRPHPIAS